MGCGGVKGLPNGGIKGLQFASNKSVRRDIYIYIISMGKRYSTFSKI